VTQIRKPNGVKLTYHGMRIEAEGMVFDGVNGVTKKWGTERTYGGRLVENLVQSVARDVMATMMLSCAEVPVMTVHDEIVWEVPEGTRVMANSRPSWAPGLPVGSKLSVGRRYAK
jgi:DNA polymerase